MKKHVGANICQLAALSLLVCGLAADMAFQWRAGPDGKIVCNTGVAFGFLGTLGERSIVIMSVVILGLLLVVSFLVRDRIIISTGLLFIAAGGMSNTISRMISGCVVDWICFGDSVCGNVADGAVDGGVALVGFGLLYSAIRKGNDEGEKECSNEKENCS